MKELVAGMDLHSNNVVCGLVNTQNQRLAHKRLPCNLDKILKWLQPYQDQLRSVAVESTFNWYWLVDGLQEHGFEVVLANPAQIRQYEGLKHGDDLSDAFFLAELQQLGILPTGHIYDREIRPVRDLLRRRLMLVRHRTALKLSLKSLYTRTRGDSLSLSQLQRLEMDDVAELFADGNDQFIGKEELRLIGELTASIEAIEQRVLKQVKDWPSYRWLQSLPGVGKVLGLTIALETGPIERFAKPGNYASYCRCVRSERLSNGKVKGTNNGKNGNRYLAWAWVEVGQYARRYYSPCRRFFDRKAGEANPVLATKALACKLSKAGWHVMKEQQPFDWRKAFGSEPAQTEGKTAKAVGRNKEGKGKSTSKKKMKT